MAPRPAIRIMVALVCLRTASDQFIRFSVKVSPKLRWHLLIQQITMRLLAVLKQAQVLMFRLLIAAIQRDFWPLPP